MESITDLNKIKLFRFLKALYFIMVFIALVTAVSLLFFVSTEYPEDGIIFAIFVIVPLEIIKRIVYYTYLGKIFPPKLSLNNLNN